MQQIFLTGECAGEVAARALSSLRVRTAGYRLLPLEVAGCLRGRVLHLLTMPDEPYFNDVPCDVQLAPGQRKIIREVFGKIAAPALRQAVSAHVPLFIDGVCREMLQSKAFCEAVTACVKGRCQVFAVVEADAAEAVRAMSDRSEQLWIRADVGHENEALRQLLQELSMRL